MGTMKVLAPVVDTLKRPHMLLMMYTLAVFQVTLHFPNVRIWFAGFSAIVCLLVLPFVGRDCLPSVRYLERMNTLFLAILFCGVASI